MSPHYTKMQGLLSHALVASRRVVAIVKWLPGAKAPYIISEQLGQALLVMDAVAGNMGCQDHIWHRIERTIGRQRLLFGHVQPRAHDPLLFQSANKRLLVDNAPARDIDEISVWSHGTQLRLANQSLGIRRERNRQHDVITLAEQLVQLLPRVVPVYIGVGL